MSTDFTDTPPEPGPPTGVVRLPRGHPVIAWIVVIAAVTGLFVYRLFQPPTEGQQIDVFEIQARALVGAAELGPGRNQIYKQAQELDRGPAAQRLGFVVLAGELKGPDEALARLNEFKDLLNKGEVPHASEAEVQQARATAEILGRLYRDYSAGDLSAADVGEADRQTLQRRLGWLGDLALNPRGGPNPAARAAVLAPARRSVVIEGLIAAIGLGGGVIGFCLLVLFAVLWRRMRARVHVGSPYGGLYAESFALWLVLYVGLSRALAMLPAGVPLGLEAGLPGVVSLVAAVAWPVLRGAPWRQVRRDIGWWAGDRPALEPFYGVVCYLAALPLVILGAVFLAVVMRLRQQWGGHDLFGPTDTPTHPIVDYIVHSGWSGWLQALFLASVMAPLMEETMFRGVLYRHLREATGRMGRPLSVVLSALLVSFVFASLHPQGALAIPVLMALAIGFTAAREWRGSLVPSMTVHALHNGLLLVMLILTAG